MFIALWFMNTSTTAEWNGDESSEAVLKIGPDQVGKTLFDRSLSFYGNLMAVSSRNFASKEYTPPCVLNSLGIHLVKLL